MIDIHCHVLYGVDDGPQTLEEALALAQALVAEGVTQVVATPHILNPPLSEFSVAAGIGGLEKEYQKAGIELEIISGGEVHYDHSLPEMRTHTINGGRYLLLEFPHSNLPRVAGELIFSIMSAGLIPIIAHPERNASILQNPELLASLVKQGALSQLTAASLVGDFGSPTRQCARYLLKKGLVHFLATDAHGATWRAPRLRKGLREAQKLLGTDRANRLVLDNPRCVLKNLDWEYDD